MISLWFLGLVCGVVSCSHRQPSPPNRVARVDVAPVSKTPEPVLSPAELRGAAATTLGRCDARPSLEQMCTDWIADNLRRGVIPECLAAECSIEKSKRQGDWSSAQLRLATAERGESCAPGYDRVLSVLQKGNMVWPIDELIDKGQSASVTYARHEFVAGALWLIAFRDARRDQEHVVVELKDPPVVRLRRSFASAENWIGKRRGQFIVTGVGQLELRDGGIDVEHETEGDPRQGWRIKSHSFHPYWQCTPNSPCPRTCYEPADAAQMFEDNPGEHAPATPPELADVTEPKSVTSLELSGSGIQSVLPLARFTSLEILDLSNTQVSDIWWLHPLFELRSIDLSQTQVDDLGPLRGLTQLERLALRGTPVYDLEPLGVLANLRELDLAHTLVRDVSPLVGLKALKVLHLENTNIDEAQLAALRSALPNVLIHQ